MRHIGSYGFAIALLLIASASHAFGTSYSVSTRGQGNDNSPQTTTSTYKPLGGGGTGTPGVCYMIGVSGSFRGGGEYLKIEVNSSGFYAITGESHTGYGGGSEVGPKGTMNCIDSTQIGIKAANLASFSVTPNSPNATFGHTTSDPNTQTDWVPWSGVNGFMWWDNASSKTDVISWSLLLETTAAQSYPTGTCGSTPQCEMTTYSYSNASSTSGENFVYDATYQDYECDLDNSDGDGGPTCTLASGYSTGTPTSICWISGIKGYWNSQATAKIVGNGTHWEIDLTGSQSDHTWAEATCMVVPQSL